MSPRATRRLLFVSFALALPLPMLGPFDAFVPALRYGLLFAAAAAVATSEGAAGPVPGILLLLGFHVLAGLMLCWGLAWGLARLASGLEAALRRTLAWVVVGGLFALGLAFEIYRTGFGNAPTSNWWGLFP